MAQRQAQLLCKVSPIAAWGNSDSHRSRFRACCTVGTVRPRTRARVRRAFAAPGTVDARGRRRSSSCHCSPFSRAGFLPPHPPSPECSQYISIAFTERLAAAGVDASVGTVAGAYDNALAESTIGLYKTELIKTRTTLADLRPSRDRRLEVRQPVQPPPPTLRRGRPAISRR